MSTPHPAAERRHERAAAATGSLGLIIGILIVIALALVFVKFSDEVVEQDYRGFDQTVALTIHATTSPTQTAIMLQVTNLGQYYLIGFAVITLIVGAVLLWRARHDPRYSFKVALVNGAAPLVALGGAAALSFVIKEIVGRQRPHLFPPLAAESGYSFPSGHALTSIAFYGMCAFLIARLLPAWSKAGVTLLAAIIVGAISYSRVYLGVHYPTDVIGSLIIGAAWLLALMLTVTTVEDHVRLAHAVKQQANMKQEGTPTPPPMLEDGDVTIKRR